MKASVEVEKSRSGIRTGTVHFESVPCFAFAIDLSVDVPGLGPVTFDIGYGGAFYAILPAASVGLDLGKTPLSALVETADRITKRIQATTPLDHPDDGDLAFLYGTILTDADDGKDRPTRNVCVFAEREVDRSPTGSGVSARMAVQVARGQAQIGNRREFESLTGAVFSGKAVSRETAGRFDAVRVEVGGRAYYSGECAFTLEDGDEIGKGFLLT